VPCDETFHYFLSRGSIGHTRRDLLRLLSSTRLLSGCRAPDCLQPSSWSPFRNPPTVPHYAHPRCAVASQWLAAFPQVATREAYRTSPASRECASMPISQPCGMDTHSCRRLLLYQVYLLPPVHKLSNAHGPHPCLEAADRKHTRLTMASGSRL